MKKNKKIKKTTWIMGSLYLIAIGFASYAYYDYMFSYTKGVNPEFGDNNPAKEIYFNAEEGCEFHASNGTHLSIPPNSFSLNNGQKVSGKIKVKLKEYHDAKSILLSGIPMQSFENRNNYMQSAGMMEIRAYLGSEELNLSKGESITISLAALNKVDANYNLYFLKNNEKWEETGSFSTDSNKIKLSKLKGLGNLPEIPKNPKTDSNDFVFSLSMDYKNAPHLKPFKNVDWIMVKRKEDGIPYDEFRKGWNKIKVKQIDLDKDLFEITFSRRVHRGRSNRPDKKETYKLLAKPALKGKQLAKAIKKYNDNLKKYEILLANKEKEEERIELESDLVNNFQIQSLGIWNCDRYMNTDLYASGTYEFDFEDRYLPFINKVKLYLVLNDQNSVVTYNNVDWDNIPFFMDENIDIFAVLPDLSVAHISSKEYSEKVNKETVSKFFTNSVRFNSEIIPKEAAFSYIKNLRDKPNQIAYNN